MTTVVALAAGALIGLAAGIAVTSWLVARALNELGGWDK